MIGEILYHMNISNSIEAVILYHSPSTAMMENIHNNRTSKTAKGFALSCAGNDEDGVDICADHVFLVDGGWR